MGLGGKEEVSVGAAGSYLTAIDYRTGKARWRHRFYSNNIGGGGLLTTAGGLLFSGDGSSNLVAYDAIDGRSIWNARIGQITNAPQTFELDGHQYVICASGDTLWSFILH
jgi:alcohol dehydrogenase (cytochrome c)